MIIKNLNIQGFRNITHSELQLSPRFNVFYGHNGSGKTSLLEAIYYLGLAKSFRTSNPYRVIHNEQVNCRVVAELSTSGGLIPLGIERNREGQRILRKGGENVASISSLARELALQLLTADSHVLFTEGPKLRRQFLDWGLFHVEPRFYPLWNQLQKVLKQRNSALKAKLSLTEIKTWDGEFIRLAEAIDTLRLEHLKLLSPLANQLFHYLLPELKLEIGYECGWDRQKGLTAVLNEEFMRDFQIGHTQSGPHRADLLFSTHNIPIQDHLSQGQLKLAAYALHLAQGKLLHETRGTAPIYLIDDIPSELDSAKRSLVLAVLNDLGAQTFLTGIQAEDLNEVSAISDSKLFHVKQGEIFSLSTCL